MLYVAALNEPRDNVLLSIMLSFSQCSVWHLGTLIKMLGRALAPQSLRSGLKLKSTGTCVVQNKVGGVLLLDPTDDEAYRQEASAMMAHMPLSNMVRTIPLISRVWTLDFKPNRGDGVCQVTLWCSQQNAWQDLIHFLTCITPFSGPT